MERHGSESYFVLGEGLLGESVGGRVLALAAAATAAPPFRFSRMGPAGGNLQLAEGNRKKVGTAMTEPPTVTSPVPAGFTYVGQFIDHDMTFDVTQVMLGQNVSPAQLLQARSPSLDLDSLYGAGPADPESAKFYSDGVHLKIGDTVAAGDPAMAGFDLPRVGVGADEEGSAGCTDPRQAERREPGGGADAPGVDPLPQPRGRQPPGRAHRRAEVRAGARAGGQALPVDDPHRLPAPDLRERGPQRRLQQRPQGVRGERDPDGRADDADRVLGRRVPARPHDDPVGLQLEQELRRRRRHARPPVRVLRAERHPRRRGEAAEQLDRRLPPTLRLRRGPAQRPRRAGREVQPLLGGSTRSWSTRCARCRRRRSGHRPSPRRTRSATSPSATSRARRWSSSRPASRWRPSSRARA